MIHGAPLGLPLTPFRYRGISLYVNGEKSIHLNSTYRGFEEICELLEKKKIPKSSPSPVWYHYPVVVSRSLRYASAYLFCILYSVFLSFSLLILPVAYFVYKRKNANSKKEGIAEDTWISVLTGIALLLIAFFLLQAQLITTLICFIPTVFYTVASVEKHLHCAWKKILCLLEKSRLIRYAIYAQSKQ